MVLKLSIIQGSVYNPERVNKMTIKGQHSTDLKNSVLYFSGRNDRGKKPRYLVSGKGEVRDHIQVLESDVLIGVGDDYDGTWKPISKRGVFILIPKDYSTVSRTHCRLALGKDGWGIQDMTSQNGTFVYDGKEWHDVPRVARGATEALLLHRGDQIWLGRRGAVKFLVDEV